MSLVFIKLEGALADEFTRQRTQLEDEARKMDPDASFPPDMFVNFMLDVRRMMESVDAQKVENVTEIEDGTTNES